MLLIIKYTFFILLGKSKHKVFDFDIQGKLVILLLNGNIFLLLAIYSTMIQTLLEYNLNFLFYIVGTVFLYYNFLIVRSDIKYKKIPNSLLISLIILLPIWHIALYFYSGNIISRDGVTFMYMLSEFFISTGIFFLLFYYGLWAAGDSKYIIVLTLFIPFIGPASLIGNLSIILIGFIVFFLFYLYVLRSCIEKGYAKSLLKHIFTEQKDKFIAYTTNNEGKRTFLYTIQSILIWFIVFLIIYISYRFLRMYLINDLLTPDGNSGLIGYIFNSFNQEHRHYIIFSIIILYLTTIFLGFLLLLKILANPYKNFRSKLQLQLNVSEKWLDIIGLATISSLLSLFLIHQYIRNPEWLGEKLYSIFTFSLIIYITIKLLIYIYKLTFQLSEVSYINIKSLSAGDIVDKEYIINLLGKQKILGAFENESGILYPDPQKSLSRINSPITEDDCSLLVNCYEIVNNYHQDSKTRFFEPIQSIKTLKTFAFGGYIFAAFILTFSLGNSLFESFVLFIINLVEKFFS